MSFIDDVKRFELKAKGDIDKAARQAALALFTKVVNRTPVGNPTLWKSPPPKGYVGGRARGNWNVNIGSINAPVSDTKKATDGLSAENLAAFSSWQPLKGQTIWLANGLPYMLRLEYEGWSKQAPAGMVRVSLKEVKIAKAKI